MAPNEFTNIPTGDMPGDSVVIGDAHVAKASAIYPKLTALLQPLLADGGRAVVSVYGGSGVGKSEIGSVLAEMLRRDGIGSYVLSGDNYPHRIPSENDAERLRHFEHGGRAELGAYLGTPAEQDFDQLNAIIAAFKAGAPTLHLKRMGRTPDALWYDDVDMSDTRVLVIEWTHGNNPNLRGVDVPIFLNSTPAETLAHRAARARDGAVDSPFTTIVLELEQKMLASVAPRAAIIVAKDGSLLTHEQYNAAMAAEGRGLSASPMLNAYPDSLGGRLPDLVALLSRPELTDAFGSLYLLPSVFNTDLDRGFSVIDYSLAEQFGTRADLQALAASGLDMKFDFILNHASVLSPQFQDLLAKGDASEYADFFIDWNAFWAGHGEMTPEGYIQPDADLIKDMFFRKPGLPILMVRMPDGTEKPYWNTFYQEVSYPLVDAQDLMVTGLQYGVASQIAERANATLSQGGRPADIDFTGAESHRHAVVDYLEGRRRYLGQMDLNIRSPKVWDFYRDVLATLVGYGASIVRLDAFAYAPKEPGARNFLNDPGTWALLAKVREIADRDGVVLLPEIHATYAEGIYAKISELGYLTYDFFLPGLLIQALDRADATVLKRWIDELVTKKIRTVNMLGCHDGIPVLDLKGLLPDDEIQHVIDTIVGRGGYVKDLHGAKAMYYQVNATYYSALGASDAALLLARAIQLFMPGKPQVWYLDLFAGENDIPAIARGHKEINRTNLSNDDIEAGLKKQVVADQLELLRFRSTFGAFGFDAELTVDETNPERLVMTWRQDGLSATLDADLAAVTFTMTGTNADGTPAFQFTSGR